MLHSLLAKIPVFLLGAESPECPISSFIPIREFSEFCLITCKEIYFPRKTSILLLPSESTICEVKTTVIITSRHSSFIKIYYKFSKRRTTYYRIINFGIILIEKNTYGVMLQRLQLWVNLTS